jgi:hypothetical protein
MSAHTGKRHRLPMLQARLRATFEGAPAFRRFTAALTTGYYPGRRSAPRVKHAPCGPVLLPADRCPRAARERIAFHPRAGTASRLRLPKVPSRKAPLVSGTFAT